MLLHLPSCSYPCGTAPATWDPDLPWLAAATEAAGFDFRVIVATRRPRDIVRDPYNGFTAERIATAARRGSSCRSASRAAAAPRPAVFVLRGSVPSMRLPC